MGKIMKIKELCDNERAKSKKYLKYLKKKILSSNRFYGENTILERVMLPLMIKKVEI